MSGTTSLNDAVSASGFDPGTAPDWRSVVPSSARLSFATPQFSCTRNERDWFLYLAYSAGERPGTVLRRFPFGSFDAKFRGCSSRNSIKFSELAPSGQQRIWFW
jgi:hypothetical protein